MSDPLKLLKRPDGQSLVEFAIFLPVLLVMIVGILQLSDLIITRQNALMEARTVNSFLSVYTRQITSGFWEMWSSVSIGDSPFEHFVQRFQTGGLAGRDLMVWEDDDESIRYRLRHRTFEESLSGDEIAKIKSVLQRYPESPFHDAVQNLGYMDLGYEALGVRVSRPPYPLFRRFHPQNYVVHSDCALNMSEGLKPEYQETFRKY